MRLADRFKTYGTGPQVRLLAVLAFIQLFPPLKIDMGPVGCILYIVVILAVDATRALFQDWYEGLP